MMENKRNVSSFEKTSVASLSSKRHKPELAFSTRDKKDKVGDRITALQQLVSPFGKTDTASVLQEAMQYIEFLHEQVKVLSAPYLETAPTTNAQDLEEYMLSNRGLCLVPISCTVGVARSNGADIWAPIKNTSPRY